MAEEFNEIPNLDDLLSEQLEFSDDNQIQENVNFLFIGRRKLFTKLSKYLESETHVNFIHVKKIEEAIDHLLRDIFAIVLLDNEARNMDLITISRIVRVNHPLARIVALSNSRRSLFVADIINHGAVDAYLPLPADEHEFMTVISEQQAKHDIDRMLTSFASEPPRMSAASYLLLDPSLTADESEPVKFVGIMVAYKSVPRYSQYFEDLLAKDEILFAGYLSGITILGQELLQSNEPLKEINFGGISVIFRFDDDVQYSIFVRNLSKHNVEHAEEVISTIIASIKAEMENVIASTSRPRDSELDRLDELCSAFVVANEEVVYRHELKKHEHTHKGRGVMFYGTDKEDQEKIVTYLSTRADYNTYYTTNEDEAKEMISDHDIHVLVLDSDLNNTMVQSPLDFADFVKDEYPSTQVIYQMRDRRASSPIIRSLNSGAINFLISYRVTRKELKDWLATALEKAIEIQEKASTIESGSLNAAVIAKTKIRSNEDSYLTDRGPLLDGIFISVDEKPVFKRFWDTGVKNLDEQMLAGLVASLESVGGEMFYDDSTVGGLELGESNLMVEHRENLNIVYFIKNIGSHNANLVKRDLDLFTDRLWVVLNENTQYDNETVKAQLDTICNNILSEFTEKYGIAS